MYAKKRNASRPGQGGHGTYVRPHYLRVHSHDHGDDAQALCMQTTYMQTCAAQKQHTYTHAHTMSSLRIHTCYSFLFVHDTVKSLTRTSHTRRPFRTPSTLHARFSPRHTPHTPHTPHTQRHKSHEHRDTHGAGPPQVPYGYLGKWGACTPKTVEARKKALGGLQVCRVLTLCADIHTCHQKRGMNRKPT